MRGCSTLCRHHVMIQYDWTVYLQCLKFAKNELAHIFFKWPGYNILNLPCKVLNGS